MNGSSANALIDHWCGVDVCHSSVPQKLARHCEHNIRIGSLDVDHFVE
jgi:hypothetical protein